MSCDLWSCFFTIWHKSQHILYRSSGLGELCCDMYAVRYPIGGHWTLQLDSSIYWVRPREGPTWSKFTQTSGINVPPPKKMRWDEGRYIIVWFEKLFCVYIWLLLQMYILIYTSYIISTTCACTINRSLGSVHSLQVTQTHSAPAVDPETLHSAPDSSRAGHLLGVLRLSLALGLVSGHSAALCSSLRRRCQSHCSLQLNICTQ